MTNDAELAEFTVLAKRPLMWQRTAREYIVAANYLQDWYDVSRGVPDAARFQFTLGGPTPMMVLYAVAVENLLKAIRVALGDEPVVDDELSGHFKHHNLVSHAEQAKFTLEASERDLLEHLSDFVQAGRYPVATAPGGSPRALQFDYPADVERVWELLERLENALRATGCDALPAFDLRARYRPPGYTLTELM